MHFGFPTGVEAKSPPVNLYCNTQTIGGGGGSGIKGGKPLGRSDASDGAAKQRPGEVGAAIGRTAPDQVS